MDQIKNAQMNILHFRFLFFNLIIFGKIVTPLKVGTGYFAPEAKYPMLFCYLEAK